MSSFSHPLPLSWEATLSTPQDTQKLGEKIATHISPGDTLALEGDLGSGKTFLARCIIQTICTKKIPVPSPTFSLLQFYETPLGPLYHFDFYRLAHPQEAWELGLEEALSQGIIIAEWPQQVAPLIPFSFYLVLENIPDLPYARHAKLFSKNPRATLWQP